MCETKPGLRCAADTCDTAILAREEYETAHPSGPQVDPISAASHAFTQPPTSVSPGVAAAWSRLLTVGDDAGKVPTQPAANDRTTVVARVS